MKTIRALVALVCVALLGSGCGSGPKSLIVGKWEAGGAAFKITAEFSRNGTSTLTMFGQPVKGKYKLIGNDEMEWTALDGTTTKYKVKVTGKELEVSGAGQTVRYKRV